MTDCILAFSEGNCALFGLKWVIFGVLTLQKQGETFDGFRRKMARSFYLS